MASIAWTRDVQRSVSAAGAQDESDQIRHRMHPAIFRIVFGAFLWMIVAAFAGFAGGSGSAFLIGVATYLLAVYLTVPYILERFRRYRDGKRGDEPLAEWAEEYVETEAGPLKGKEAMLQAATGPVSLAVGITAIAVVAGLVS